MDGVNTCVEHVACHQMMRWIFFRGYSGTLNIACFKKKYLKEKWIKIKFSPLSISLSFESKCINARIPHQLSPTKTGKRRDKKHRTYHKSFTQLPGDSIVFRLVDLFRFREIFGNDAELFLRRRPFLGTRHRRTRSSRGERVGRQKRALHRDVSFVYAREEIRGGTKVTLDYTKQRILMTKFFYLVFRVSKWKGKREGGRSGQKILPDDFERINASS